MFKPGDKIVVSGMAVKAECRYIGHSSDGSYVAYEYKTDDGHITASTIRASRVSPVPVKKEGWVNIYQFNYQTNPASCGEMFFTKEEALKKRSPNCVDTVKIEWEETP